MVFRCPLVLSICAIGRKERPDVNICKMARKLLKSLDGSIERGDAIILDGKGAPLKMVKKTFGVCGLPGSSG